MPVSEADYWEFYYLGHEVTYEWNNGILEEKGVSDYLTFQVYDWFLRLLMEFLSAHPIANRVGLEMGFRLALSNKVAIRRPDYGVVLHGNPVPLAGPINSYRVILIYALKASPRPARPCRSGIRWLRKWSMPPVEFPSIICCTIPQSFGSSTD
jgi:hypothetical protein